MATKKPTQKPIPVVTEPKNEELKPTEIEIQTMNESPLLDSLPEQKELKQELPKDYNEANAVKFGDEIREIKSTKMKYQRNRTAIAYKILQIYPSTDVVCFEKGTFDPDRDGDQILFDFLVAVFDDAEFVKKYYDEMTSQDIDRIVEIFCRVNNITEKEEQAKNRAAKGTKT